MFEIKHLNGSKIFKSEPALNVKECLIEAIKSKAYLQGADLRGVDLRGAYLQGADLRGVDLRGAYLQGADLRWADLQGADLRWAYLRGVDLQGADLRGVDLRGAYLQGADLRWADLRGAYLRGVDLRGAYLQGADLHDQKQSIAPLYLIGFDLDICISRESMAIGCKVHKHEEWFSDFALEVIEKYCKDDDHKESLTAQWVALKPALKKLCVIHKKANDAVATVKQLEGEAKTNKVLREMKMEVA